ncbi:MAG: hypothetical protein HBSAPP04_27920 [Ignavibacteriaceae bacterium]|nr:MAG: hypothetical protein HBSAPP04_27920 [Ignavibacteriaceae bacterium]
MEYYCEARTLRKAGFKEQGVMHNSGYLNEMIHQLLKLLPGSINSFF